MKPSRASQGQPAAELISQRIAARREWRGETLGRVRKLIKDAHPEVVEEVKWRKPSNPAGVPVWEHDGIICTGETYMNHVRLTSAKGAALKAPRGLCNASLEGTPCAPSSFMRETRLTSRRSRRSFAGRSPSTALASRSVPRSRSPEHRGIDVCHRRGARCDRCRVQG